MAQTTPEWATHPGHVSALAYGLYLRHHQSDEPKKPESRVIGYGYLTDEQHARLLAVARTVVLVTTPGDCVLNASGYAWLGCTIARKLRETWKEYERSEAPAYDEALWLVWCWVRDGREVHIVVPIDVCHSTMENTSHACAAIAHVVGCPKHVGSVLCWVKTGQVEP